MLSCALPLTAEAFEFISAASGSFSYRNTTFPATMMVYALVLLPLSASKTTIRWSPGRREMALGDVEDMLPGTRASRAV